VISLKYGGQIYVQFESGVFQEADFFYDFNQFEKHNKALQCYNSKFFNSNEKMGASECFEIGLVSFWGAGLNLNSTVFGLFWESDLKVWRCR
jgi:hypothetical protein